MTVVSGISIVSLRLHILTVKQRLTILLYETLSQYRVWLRAGRPGDQDSIPVRGERIFSSNLCVQTGSGAHPASCTMGTGGRQSAAGA
jgi:hypothetical protein